MPSVGLCDSYLVPLCTPCLLALSAKTYLAYVLLISTFVAAIIHRGIKRTPSSSVVIFNCRAWPYFFVGGVRRHGPLGPVIPSILAIDSFNWRFDILLSCADGLLLVILKLTTLAPLALI